MEFSIFKCETEIKVIMGLIFLGIRWLYKYLTALDGSMVNEALDEDEIEDQHTPPIRTLPTTSKVPHKVAQALPFPRVVAEKPRLSQSPSSAIKHEKISFGSKRKLFRRALLIDALMWRKDFIG